jgi:CheY-like chemotaxis protein
VADRSATGYGQSNDRVQAADAGFDFHLVKPVSVRDLVSVLDERVVSSDTDPDPARNRS